MIRLHSSLFRALHRLRAMLSRIAAVAMLLFFATGVHATVRCVATVNGGLDANDDGLMASLSAANAASEGSTWEIRLRPGVYQLSTDQFWFRPDGSKDSKNFKMSGGWDATCQNRVGTAHNTILRGAPGYTTSFYFYGDNASYDIEYIRFENFFDWGVADSYCPTLSICPDTDSIVVEHNEFANGGSVGVSDNDAKRLVFRHNLAVNLFGSVYVSIYHDEDTAQVSFNTIAGITCDSAENGALNLFSTTTDVSVHHNIVQSSSGCGQDVVIDTSKRHDEFVDQFPGQSLRLYYNLFGSVSDTVAGDIFDDHNVVSTNPKFKDAANGNYRLQDASPAVNSGGTVIDALLSGFETFGMYDLDDKARPVGDNFDIGAYESNVYDNAPAVITVNSANDVDDGTCNATHCSLREAINLANTQDNIAQRITFDISGSCPRVILIDSPLPDVTDSLTIDGYTQPGANANELDFGSNANICIGITPGAVGVSHALQVPTGEPDATRLSVRGLAFGSSLLGFGTSAIVLRAGSGHRIVGNAFGGYLPPSHNTESIGSLPRSVVVRGTAKGVHIGSTAAADRNYIGNNNENAIVLNDPTSKDHFIENNYIGLRPDGLTAQQNYGDGISSSGSDNVTINDNTIVASAYGIGLLGANTTNFKITNNRIGANALYIANPTLSNEVGVVVALGSGGHVIGSKSAAVLGAGAQSNYINNNLGDGVLVDGDAGATNTIRGNLIRDNGQGGVGIGIDLGGSQSPLANDDADADTGPNALQNHPAIYGSKPTDATHRSVSAAINTAPNQTLRVDFYHANFCTPARGADANYLVGSVDVAVGASGIAMFTAPVAEAGKSGYLTATATTTSGKTSELAACVPEDRIFADGAQKAGL
jgi:CSLREA domain-containing protein